MNKRLSRCIDLRGGNPLCRDIPDFMKEIDWERVTVYPPHNMENDDRLAVADFFRDEFGMDVFHNEEVLFSPGGISLFWKYYLDYLRWDYQQKKNDTPDNPRPLILTFPDYQEQATELANAVGGFCESIPNVTQESLKELKELKELIKLGFFKQPITPQNLTRLCKKFPCLKNEYFLQKVLDKPCLLLPSLNKKYMLEIKNLLRSHQGSPLFFYHPNPHQADEFIQGFCQHHHIPLVTHPSDIHGGKPWSETEPFDPGKPVILTTDLTYGLAKQTAEAPTQEDADFECLSVPLRPENDYRLDPKDLENTLHYLCQQGRPVVCFKCDNPQNPTGHLLTPTEAFQVAAICYNYNVPIFEDLAYAGLEYQGQTVPFNSLHHKDLEKHPPFYTFHSVNPKYFYDWCHQHIFTAWGLSKAAGMPGVRTAVGFTGNKDVYTFIQKKITQTSLSPPSFTANIFRNWANPKHKKERDKFLRNNLKEYDFRRRLMLACLKGQDWVPFSSAEQQRITDIIQSLDERHIPKIQEKIKTLLTRGIPGVDVVNSSPDAGFFLLLKFDTSLGTDSRQIASALEEHGGPKILPSSFFMVPHADGTPNPHTHLARVSFSFEQKEIILLAMLKLSMAVDNIRSAQQGKPPIKVDHQAGSVPPPIPPSLGQNNR